ncbi:hypothetical protein [Actinoallomurus sp. CA-150999]|uniref:hypothetical protein n=1 Tax=Actinoallomurus sp. CA-150999 TaxID=3239887 RepID=UPI003D8E180F
MSLRKRSISAVAGLAVASGLILTLAPAAAASSGGGCRSYTANSTWKWKLRSCISAHKNVVRPDFYVDRVGKHDRGYCRIDVSLKKSRYKDFFDAKSVWHHSYGCKKGHVPYSIKKPVKAHGYYRFWVTVHYRKAPYDFPLVVDSPTLHN